MAGGKANYLNNKLLNFLFNGASFTPPATLYFALFTVTPSDSAAGTEVVGSVGYSRIAVTGNTTNFPTTTTETIQNGTAIAFGTASGAGWGTVVAAAIMDAASSGNMLYWGPLGANRTVLSGDTFTIPINGLTVTEA